VIKDINEPMKIFSINVMDNKFLRKFTKEEALTRSIAAVAQCAKGVVFS